MFEIKITKVPESSNFHIVPALYTIALSKNDNVLWKDLLTLNEIKDFKKAAFAMEPTIIDITPDMIQRVSNGEIIQLLPPPKPGYRYTISIKEEIQ